MDEAFRLALRGQKQRLGVRAEERIGGLADCAVCAGGSFQDVLTDDTAAIARGGPNRWVLRVLGIRVLNAVGIGYWNSEPCGYWVLGQAAQPQTLYKIFCLTAKIARPT